MKRSIITLAVALSAAAVAPLPAQEQEPQRRPPAHAGRMDPAQRIERRVQLLSRELDLTAEQASRIRAILTAEGERLRAFFQQNGGARPDNAQARAAFRAELQKVREQTRTEIATVLTADQLQKYQQLQEQRQRAPHRHHGATQRS